MPGHAAAVAATPSPKRAVSAAASAVLSESARKLRDLELAKASKVEMNLLAQLVNVQKAPHDNFTLQLFQDSGCVRQGGDVDAVTMCAIHICFLIVFYLDARSDAGSSGGGSGQGMIIMFDASDKKDARTKEIERQMGGFSVDDSKKASKAASPAAAATSSGDDLLDLLDSAS